MRNIFIKSIILIVSWLMILAFFSFQTTQGKKDESHIENKIEKQTKEESSELIVQVMHNGVQEHIPLETYLEGVVASEMPYTFEMEALKAQCVAARTFVLKRNLNVDDSTGSQVYRSENELIEIHQENYDAMITRIRQAINETKGLVMRYQGEYISALFYSSNNGKSNDASWYYQNEVPYLKSVDSPWDLQFENTVQTKELGLQECMNALNVSSFNIGSIQYYDNGYIASIEIGEKIFSGREVREKLDLRSSCFTINIQNDIVLITTTGFGHGVGMSQYGALGMAQEGYDFKAILNHYYYGIHIEKIES